jgi:hypothetical protein
MIIVVRIFFMTKIYCIEDINDLKYVGSTTRTIERRLIEHRQDKRNKPDKNISSYKLNLEYCIVYLLEECPKENKDEREQHWIDKLDCVNKNKVSGHNIFRRREYQREWHRRNRKRLRDLTAS